MSIFAKFGFGYGSNENSLDPRHWSETRWRNLIGCLRKVPAATGGRRRCWSAPLLTEHFRESKGTRIRDHIIWRIGRHFIVPDSQPRSSVRINNMLKNYVATYMGIITIEAVVNLLIQTTYCIRNNTTKTSSQISNDWIQISSLWAETVRKNKQVLSCDHLVVRSIGTKITEQISICEH